MDLTSLLCASGRSEGLRRQLLTSLQRLIPHDLGACHWMRPERHEIAAWYEPQRRSLPLPDAEFWRLIRTHPLNSVLFGHPARAWMLSDVMPRKTFRQTELYARLYRPLGVDCELTAVLPDKHQSGQYFLVSLHRREHDFTERDRTVLNLLLPHIARAQHRLELRHDQQDQATSVFANETEFHEWLRQMVSWELSHRESDVLFWLAQGKTNDEIGTILGIAGRTAETHALRIYPKIGVENRYGAITTVAQMMARHERFTNLPASDPVRLPTRLSISG